MDEHIEGKHLIAGTNCYFNYAKWEEYKRTHEGQGSPSAANSSHPSAPKSSTKKKKKKKKNKSSTSASAPATASALAPSASGHISSKQEGPSSAPKFSVNDVSFVDPDADYPESRLIKVGPNGDLIVESLDDEYSRQPGASSVRKMVPPVPSIPQKLATKIFAFDDEQQRFWNDMSVDAQKQMFTIDANAITESVRQQQKELASRNIQADGGPGHEHSWAQNSKCYCSRCERNDLHIVNIIDEGFDTYMDELMEGLWEQFELQYHDLKPNTKFVDVKGAENVLHDKYVEAQNLQRFAEIKQIKTAGANAGEMFSTVRNLELFYYLENILAPSIQRDFMNSTNSKPLSGKERRAQVDTFSCVHQILCLIQSMNDRTRLLRETQGEGVRPLSPKEFQRMVVSDNLIDCLHNFLKEGMAGIPKAVEFMKILSSVGRTGEHQFPDVTEQMSKFADMFQNNDGKSFIDVVAKLKASGADVHVGDEDDDEDEDDEEYEDDPELEHYALKNPFSHCKCDFHSQLSEQFEAARSKAIDQERASKSHQKPEDEDDDYDDDDDEEYDDDDDDEDEDDHRCEHGHHDRGHDDEELEDGLDNPETDEEEAEERRFKELRGFFFMEARKIIVKRFQESYKKRVSEDRTKKFIEELEAEENAKKEKELKKLKQKEKQKEKKRLQQLEKEEKRKQKEAEEMEKVALLKKKQEELRAEQKRREDEIRMKKEREKMKKIEVLKQKEQAAALEKQLQEQKLAEAELKMAELKVEPKVEKKPEPKLEKKPEPKVEKKPEPKVEKKPEPKVEKKPEPKVEKKPEPKVEKKPEPKAEKKFEPKEKKLDRKPETKLDKKADLKVEKKSDPKDKKVEKKNAEVQTPKAKSVVDGASSLSEKKKKSPDREKPTKTVGTKIPEASLDQANEKPAPNAPLAPVEPSVLGNAHAAGINPDFDFRPQQGVFPTPTDTKPSKDVDTGISFLPPKNHLLEQLYHARPRTVSTTSGDSLDFFNEPASASRMGTGYSPSKKSVSAYQSDSWNTGSGSPFQADSMVSSNLDRPQFLNNAPGAANTWSVRNSQDAFHVPPIASPLMANLPTSTMWSPNYSSRGNSIWGTNSLVNPEPHSTPLWGPQTPQNDALKPGPSVKHNKELVQSAAFKAIQEVRDTNGGTSTAMKIFQSAKMILNDPSLKMSEFLSALHSSTKYHFDIIYDDFGSVTDIKAVLQPERIFGTSSVANRSPSPQQTHMPPLFQSQPPFAPLEHGLNYPGFAPNSMPMNQPIGQPAFQPGLVQEPLQGPNNVFQPSMPMNPHFAPNSAAPPNQHIPGADNSAFQPGPFRGSSDNVNQFDSKISETMQGSLNQLGIGQARGGIW